jgi:cell division transport system ATP-binding protein
MPAIILENVSKFHKNKAERRVEVRVKDVDLTIEQGEFVFVIGSSGAGKSTLLQLITSQLKPDKGKVYLGDRDLQWLKRLSRNQVALQFGQVWQEEMLVHKKTVAQNLLLAARIDSFARKRKDELDRRVKKVLGLVGLPGIENMYPVELSIGECRRVELARALINSPPILVLDEITANLDDDCIWDILQLLQEINRHGTTVIMSTHASQYVNILRKRVITMVDGSVYGDVQKGRYGDVNTGKAAAAAERKQIFHLLLQQYPN